jgi:hypothetical protein
MHAPNKFAYNLLAGYGAICVEQYHNVGSRHAKHAVYTGRLACTHGAFYYGNSRVSHSTRDRNS